MDRRSSAARSELRYALGPQSGGRAECQSPPLTCGVRNGGRESQWLSALANGPVPTLFKDIQEGDFVFAKGRWRQVTSRTVTELTLGLDQVSLSELVDVNAEREILRPS